MNVLTVQGHILSCSDPWILAMMMPEVLNKHMSQQGSRWKIVYLQPLGEAWCWLNVISIKLQHESRCCLN